MLQIFSKNKSQLNDFIFALEKLSNIAAVKVAGKENETAMVILDGMEKLLNEFITFKKNKPQKYQDIIENADGHVSKIKFDIHEDLLQGESSQEAKQQELTQTKQQEYLNWQNQVRELILIEKFLSAFKKVWESAHDTNNGEISKYVVYRIESLLAKLVKVPGNEEYVEQILRFLNDLTWRIINAESKIKDPSIYPAAIHWYINIVFYRFSENEEFSMDYLPLFDKYFFASSKMIIAQEQELLFNSLVGNLIDGIFVPSYDQEKIWTYGHLILDADLEMYQRLDAEHEINNKINKLAQSAKGITSKDRLDTWLNEFEGIKSILTPNFNEDQTSRATQLAFEITKYVKSQYKYNNLTALCAVIGAYALYKYKPAYIRYLWEYKQPPDADATWVGDDIVPDSLDDLIVLVSGGFIERKYVFWDGRHGSRQPLEQYSVLLMARIFKQALVGIDSSSILDALDDGRLNDLSNSVEHLITVANNLQTETELLHNLGFADIEVEEIFSKTRSFLQLVKRKAQESIEAQHRERLISEEKVQEFKNDVLTAFNESAILRIIFKHYEQYDDCSQDRYSGELPRFGINMVEDKAAFFDKWHVHFSDWGKNYGRQLAQGENIRLVEEISKCCSVTRSLLDDVLAGVKDLANYFWVMIR